MSKYYLWLANTAIVLVCMMLLACAPAPDPRIGQLEARVKSLERSSICGRPCRPTGPLVFTRPSMST